AAAEAFLDRNAGALAAIEECLRRRQFVLPVSKGRIWESRAQSFLSLGRLLSCRSRLFEERGREKEAFAEALKLIRFGGRLLHAQGGLGAFVPGAKLVGEGLNRLHRLVLQGKVAAPELAAAIGELA